MFLVITSVVSTATVSNDGRDEICHRGGCKDDHPDEYYQYVLLITFEGPTSLREKNQSQVSVTIENECNTDRSKFNTFQWVDLVLTSVNGKTTIIDESKRINDMGRGSGNRRTVTWTIEGKEPGNDTLFVDIHALNSHENTNKYESGTHDIEITPLPPDISISSLKTNPSEPVEGDLVQITADVLNSGSVGSWNFTLFLNDDQKGLITIEIVRDESVQLHWNWSSSGNLGDWTARIEATGVDEEEDIEDNTYEIQFYVMTRPDIELMNISYDPSEPVDGEVVTIIAALRNNGESAATFQVYLYLDTFEDCNRNENGFSIENTIGIENVTMEGISYENVTFYWVPTKQVGEHLFIIRVDPEDIVNETDEGNNILDREITVVPPPIQSDPSIHVSDIHLPDLILEGDNITITAAVRNLGNSSLNLTTRILIHRSSLLSLTDFDFHLEPHEVRVLTIHWNTSFNSGNLTITVTVLGSDPVDERTHNNNAIKEFIILERQDPAIISVNWTPFNPMYNSQIVINATIQNLGGGEAQFISRIAFEAEEFIQPHHLLPGEEINISRLMTFFGPGVATVEIYQVSPWERNRSNNKKEEFIEAFVSQDFRIDSFMLHQPPGYFRDQHRISANISNNWHLNGTGKLIVRLDGEQVSSFNLSIPANESRSYGLDWIPTIGLHTFSATLVVAPEDPVRGYDHLKRFEVTPTLPEISVESIALSPTVLRSQDELNAYVIVTNSGGVGTNVSLTFSVDDTLKSVRKIYVPGNSQASHVFVWIAEEGEHNIVVQALEVEDGTITSDRETERSVSVQEALKKAEDDNTQFIVFTVLLTSGFMISAGIIFLEIRKGVLP